MLNFEFFAPTKVVFGKNTQAQAGTLLKEFNAKKVLIHYGSAHAEKSGLLDEIKHSLEEAGIEYTLLGGVVPNPHLALVYKGIELCRKENVDFILAVGGGSVIDSAKAIAMGVNYSGDVWDFYDGGVSAKECLPVGCVLTIAAAGSEMSNSSVITNTEKALKRGCNNDLTRCRFAIMNPELTKSLPPYQTACGTVDTMMHTLERYFTPEEPMQITDEIAHGLLRTTMRNGQKLMRRPESYHARAELMWASSLSHNGLTGCGGGGGDWACHQICHEISAMFNLTHGAALAAVWPAWARYILKSPKNKNRYHTVERFERLAEFVLEVDADETDDFAQAAIEEMESFFWSLEMPTCLPEADIRPSEEQIAEMAEKCTKQGTRSVGGLMPLSIEDVAAILKMASREKDNINK